jgi:hypothetical protein
MFKEAEVMLMALPVAIALRLADAGSAWLALPVRGRFSFRYLWRYPLQ